jgi:alkylated DNA nucleotide flippase Atl1
MEAGRMRDVTSASRTPGRGRRTPASEPVAGLPTPFAEAVLDLVERIPPGRVMAYGDVAAVLGSGGARAVGTVMARFGSGVPWHRVLRADGSPPAGHEAEALRRHRRERTPLTASGTRVDMAVARWWPESS